MKRFASLLLVLLSLAASACSNLTEAEMAQLTFIAEEALVEVADDEANEPLQSAEARPQQKGGQDAAIAGQTRRSVAAAVSAKIPVASPQGADASVWQARALIGALNLDPKDHSQCFRVLQRSFFNRCDQLVEVQTCQNQACQTYSVPAGADLTIPHDYQSLTPSFVAAEPAKSEPAKPAPKASPVVVAKSTPTKPAPTKPAPKAKAQTKIEPNQSAVVDADAQVAIAAETPAVQASKTEKQAKKPSIAKAIPGVPQGIKPEPDGSDLTSTEFFSKGGFPLTF